MISASSKQPLPPLDRAALDRIALAYVARYATTRARLRAHLKRKVERRGWAGEEAPPLDAIVQRMAALGYVDDRAFAHARAAGLARRGLGPRRIGAALAGAGIDAEESREAVDDAMPDALSAALTYARRRRIGPFSKLPPSPDARRRTIASLLRAGHDPEVARAVADMAQMETDEP